MGLSRQEYWSGMPLPSLERTLRGAHYLEAKTEAQRGLWLAQSHVVVARKGSGLHVCLPDSKTVFGQQGPGPGWETSVPSTLPFLLSIQMPAPGYSHLFSREVGGGGLPGASPLGTEAAAGPGQPSFPAAAQVCGRPCGQPFLPRSQSMHQGKHGMFLG